MFGSTGGSAPGAPASRPSPLRRVGALITPWLRLPSSGAVVSGVRAELAAQRTRLLLWTPVCFGAGSASYLGLKEEPSVAPALVAAVVLACLFLAVWRWGRSVWLTALAGMMAMTAAGFLAAKLHSDAMGAPIAPPRPGMVRIEGWVVDIDTPSARGERLVIAPTRVAGLSPSATPTRIRIVVGAEGGPDAAPAPGTPVTFVALLDPPPGPASPGAYDFARDAWFEGVGGVGLTMQQPVLADLPEPPWRLKAEIAVNAVRWSVASRLAHDIHAILGPDDGGAAGLAAAVTTSHQDWLPSADRDVLRGSGLAHMLAIAGLHTAAISGFAFFTLRLGIAAWPWLSLRVNGKKVAAVGALASVLCYLTLSGAHPPAQRAAITASVAFLAILADRRAVSLHSLAVAALAILILQPEAVVQPGFEMSFCATASLIALAEVWRRPTTSKDLPWALRLIQRARDWFLAMLVVSFVAGAATAPFAIQHFNRLANYGVFANLAADLVASVVLMPALALCLLAQLLGLGPEISSPLLAAAGWAARSVIWLGEVFATAPGASLRLSSAPEIALAISYLGIVFACLWRGRLRLIGMALSLAVALWPRPTPPVAWIAADGADAAVVISGQEVTMKPGARQYATGLWAQRRGFDAPADAERAQQAAFDCNRLSCAPLAGTRPAIGAWWTRRKPKPWSLADRCRNADIFILRADVAVPDACRNALVLRRGDFEAGGAAEVFGAPVGWRLVWSQPLRGHRPWTLSDTVE
ncbi:MAG: ComEC/Rec2 family competence protein [Caulobacteraceae bacterium]|nr:ComEC/Rec2 family competence protein [Caulobacteraceae bacterium]